MMDRGPDLGVESGDEIGLIRLSRVDYQLAEGQPDAMGWVVADIEGVQFGRVSDMLADAMTGQIVFVAVSSQAWDKTALVPVEGVYLDVDEQRLTIPLRYGDIRDCPDFNDDVVDVMPFVDYWIGLDTARRG